MDDLFSKPLAELSPADKRALLARLLTEAAAPAEQSFPLSHGQKALWFIHQLTPGTAAYNVASAIRVKGPLNVPVLRAAVQAVVDRHASLRTTFSRAASGEPLQTVHAEGSYAYTQVDATGLAWDEVYRRLSDDGYYPFDLAQAPLFRVSLYTLAPEDHVLLLVMNHIIVDFWSMSILMQDFLALYEAMSRGGAATLPPLDAQFKDSVDWERALVAGADGEALFRYWSDVLSGELPVLKLPVDRPRPPLWSDDGSLFIYRISKEMVHRLRTLAHAEGATLFMILLAVFQVLIHRISGQDDLLVGSPVAGRGLADFDQVVGYFVNTVVLRASLAEAPAFRGFLGSVRQTVLGAFAHQDYPFPLLVERLQPRRSPAYSPVFQVMFNLVQPRRMEQAGLARILLGDAGGRIRFNELEMESFSLEQRTANFDLTLTAVEVEESLFAQWQFSTRLFDTATIARLAACYETLLTAVLADPDRRISGLSLLTAAERQELLIERNRKVFDLPAAQGFLQLFEAQVERTPGSVAVVSGTTELTYRDLNAAANRLGQILVERRAGPETLIAIFAQRGVNFLISMLAAFKAGGAYLPLDPFYPAQRLRQMLENSRAPFVLVEEALVESLAGVLSAVEPRPAVLVIEELLRADHPQEENLPPRSGPGHLAYVIYTSGSTGAPKGAMVAAEGMLSHLLAKIADLELAAADVIAQTASQCFDISVWQYLAALLVGGRTHVVDATTAGDPRLLLRHAEEHGITILESVPSLIAEMVREVVVGAERPPLAALRWLVATGEDLPPELCRRWLACYPRIPLLNAYGPTECSDDVTHHAVPEPPGKDVVRMPVGRPIANLRIYVLDRALEPVPDGVTGELCAGGLGVGRGYLGEPGRTAAVFVPDPFAPSPGGRLYRTGDAARWRDAMLELLGRLDSQVKVRGQRIELQEIELVLAQHPNVGEAVVVAVRGPSEGNRLVAYVVPRQTPAPPMHSIQDLRAFLQEKLPQSMVPSAFMVLDALPHGPTGKVDRVALPAPDGERPELASTFVAPRTEVEIRLAELWAELLNVERVGVHDNFFELGGHSLLGIQLLSRVRDIYEMDVPARGFFENPTVAGLAQLVSGVSDFSDIAPAKTWSHVANLREEVSLDPAITPQGPPRSGLETIFLTGATGFLGAHLLAELLRKTEATVYCLVRSRTADDGLRKIARGLESYGLDDLGRPDFSRRVHAVPGDLARPLLGLMSADFADLAERVDTVVHNGAWVSFVLPYETLKPANVLGTQEVLRFACQGSAKPVHYISSLAVCPLTGVPGGVVREDHDLGTMEHVLGGYAQSKWVAEGLAGVARSRGLPITVYRPGLITGHSRTGATNTGDFMAGFLKGCIQLGAAPAVGTAIEMTPVDYVSSAIVQIIRQPHSAGRMYHLSNPRTVEWQDLVAWVRERGYPVRSVPFDEWLAALFALGEGIAENALYPFVALLAERDAELQETAGLPLAAVRLPRYDCANTLIALAGTPVACPPMDESLFSIYLSYFVRTGFLPAPPEQP